MEEEARRILKAALISEETGAEWVASIRSRFEPLGGVELEIPSRAMANRAAPSFE